MIGDRTLVAVVAGLAVLAVCSAAPAQSGSGMASASSYESLANAGDSFPESGPAWTDRGPLFSLRWQEGGGADASKAADSPDDDANALAKQTQNPIADLISLPFQFNINFGVGSHDRVSNVLNIQPVIPFNLNERWNLITRTILPVIYLPALEPGGDEEFGIGDLQITGWLSPKSDSGFMWGVGPVFRFPTASDDSLGSEKWSAGLSFVAVLMKGPWVAGGLVQNVWSFAGDSNRSHVSEFLLQPFVNYNLDEGWYLTSSPIITADWSRDSSDQWLIPVGGGFGKVFSIGKQRVNASLQGFYHADKPSEGPDWSMRVQFQLLFPKKKNS